MVVCRFMICFACLSLAPAAACGGGGAGADDEAPADEPADEPTDAEVVADEVEGDPAEEAVEDAADAPGDADAPPAIPEHCLALKTGFNQDFPVDDLKRSFIINLPKGATGPGGKWPVVFNWHGYGDTATNMNFLMSPLVDGDWPFILVTPESTGMEAIEWDMLLVYTDTPNHEARLLDELLPCLDARWGVDPDRVHMIGFSAGSVCSDMLGVLRGDLIASIVTFSGGYFGNPVNLAKVADLNVTWPELTTSNPYAQILLSGGTKDQWSMGPIITIHFDQLAAADLTYLNSKGHDVIDCKHGKGHSVPTNLFGAKQVVEFFRDHPHGVTPSPYAAGLPADFPQFCTFHARQ